MSYTLGMLSRFLRKWHRWISVLIAIPFLITLVTGILLATRGFNTWVQPDYPPVKAELKVSFDDLLKAAQSVPEAQIQTWKDVSQIDIRPGNGNIRIRAKANLWEIQVEGSTGKVMGAAPRRVSWLTSLHEGSFFGEGIRYGIFLPMAFGVLFLLVSGLVIFAQPFMKRRKK